ncbi:MAG: hypothetical protein WBK91_07795 [Alphaproteobacteria bacterium]
MREKNARSAMSANKLLFAAALLTLILDAQAQAATGSVGGATAQPMTSPQHQPAQEQQPPAKVYATPPLFMLKEVFIDYPILVDPKVSSDCGLTRESMLTALQRNLQDPGLDVMALHPTHARSGTRVALTVEIMSVKQGRNCISWIDMPFTDKAPVRLPPVNVPRNMTLLFWQQKKVVTSTDERHQPTVNDMLASMVRQFLRDVKLAAPNAMLEESPEEDDEERARAERNNARMKSLSESVSQRLIMEQLEPEVPLTDAQIKSAKEKAEQNQATSDEVTGKK